MSKRYALLIATIFIIGAIVLHFQFLGRAAIGLNVGLILAYIVWLSGADSQNPVPQKLIALYLLGIAVQCLHFYEEYLTGFYIKFPALFDYQWSGNVFITVNLLWLFLFILAAVGMLNNLNIAYLVVWFYAIIGGIGNGILHPVISIYQGSYFPGLLTSFAHLIVGGLLIKELTIARRQVKESPGEHFT